MEDKTKLVIAGRFESAADAHIAAGVLDSEGIKSIINNENFASLLPVGFNTIGQITLWVYAEDAEKAKELIEQSGLE